ncbi:MAG: LPS-assembly protein LptD [Bacteroidales bacterium]|nr:LPS-assembly protein LptD [Bacteroidales bacterium]
MSRKRFFLSLAALLLTLLPAVAQQPDTLAPKRPLTDTTAQIMPVADTAARAGNLERPAFTTARDSVIEDLEKNIIYYFGNVTANYGDIAITADYMAYNMDLNVVYARGQFDAAADSVIGKPVMKDHSGEYQMDEVYYNFTTRKAKIKNMATKQQEGTLVGDDLKMMPDQSFNISGGKYTVCDAEHPHYYLRMTTAKIMTEPKQKTMFGPAYLVVGDVPLPIGLPFGFVPERPDRASGLLIPSYGDETARGLYLKDLGYSFVIGDYADIALTGDIYSYGSWAVRLTSRYKLRYKFDGSLSINYSDDITGERGTPSFNESRNFGVNWTHSQDSKAHPGTSFRASVNFSSPSNNRFNSTGITQSLQNQTSSSISYSKTWSGMSVSINALHSQSSRDSSYAITFPNITFNVNRFYPFKRQNRVGKERLYEKISLSYNTTLQNKINFKLSEIHDPDFWNKMQNGMTHNFQIGLPSFSLLNYFQFSPSVSYGMNWFFREQLRVYDPDLDRVVTSYSDLFSTFGVTQNFSASISMSTRLYGTFNFGSKSKVQAIRHMITPSFSFSWRPEMGTPANGYTSLTYTKADGTTVTEEYNRFAGMLYSPPGKGRTAALSFSFANNLEAKVKSARDTTHGGVKKVKLLDQLGISGSYNFLADSMKMSNISISGSTTIFGKLGVNGNMTLNPYAINEKGQVINTFNIVKTGRPARITNAGASLSYSISGGGNYKGNDGHGGGTETGHEGHSHGGNSDYAFIYYHPVTGEYIPGGWCYYMNPNIPWSLRIGYNYSFSRSYQYSNERLQVKDNHTQTVSLSGNLRLTKALDMNFNTGFDLTKMKMSTTQVSATYDLHCFTMSISWVPNGQWESWSFRFAAKASALADILKFKKASSYWDN